MTLGDEVFNPLDKTNLAESIKDHLLRRKPVLLPPQRFNGAGIYAIYYTGSFAAYRRIATIPPSSPKAVPIYVGKAQPPGSRTGGYRLERDPGYVLHKRLSEHADSIDQCRNLHVEHFWCRYLLVDEIWIPLGESLLIERFKPVWNVVVSGFGLHDPGSTRTTQQRSAWDTVHPGRTWGDRAQTPNERSAEQILADIAAHLGD